MKRPTGIRVRPNQDAALTPLIARVARARRLSLGLSMRHVAILIDSTQPNVCRFEKGYSADMALGFLERIAHALQTTVSELVRQAEAQRSIVHGEAAEDSEAAKA